LELSLALKRRNWTDYSGWRKQAMASELEEKNKALVLRAFDTLFNKREYATAERF
jgi:hypothetical protein